MSGVNLDSEAKGHGMGEWQRFFPKLSGDIWITAHDLCETERYPCATSSTYLFHDAMHLGRVTAGAFSTRLRS